MKKAKVTDKFWIETTQVQSLAIVEDAVNNGGEKADALELQFERGVLLWLVYYEDGAAEKARDKLFGREHKSMVISAECDDYIWR